MPPTSTMTIDSTAAKIGRSMKKCENFTADASALRRQRGHLRRHLGAGTHTLQPIDDDRLATVEALADDAIAVDARARPNDARRRRAVLANDKDDPQVLVGADRLVGDQHCTVWRAAGDL